MTSFFIPLKDWREAVLYKRTYHRHCNGFKTGFPNVTCRLEFYHLCIVKAGANEETLTRKQNCVQDAKNYFWKISKTFLLSRRRFCVFNICYIGAQTRKHLGNTEETLASNVSRLFLHLRTQAIHFEDVEFASWKQKMFCFLPVCSPMQHRE